jgi:hypothetical protein
MCLRRPLAGLRDSEGGDNRSEAGWQGASYRHMVSAVSFVSDHSWVSRGRPRGRSVMKRLQIKHSAGGVASRACMHEAVGAVCMPRRPRATRTGPFACGKPTR